MGRQYGAPQKNKPYWACKAAWTRCVSFYVSADKYAELERAARANNLSVTAFVQSAIEDALDEERELADDAAPPAERGEVGGER